MVDGHEPIVIFGAGIHGKRAAEIYGDRVEYFLDNDQKKQGNDYQGFPVRSIDYYIRNHDEYLIVIASSAHVLIAEQLKKNGIMKFIDFMDKDNRLVQINELVFNPYSNSSDRNLTEEEYINQLQEEDWRKQSIRDMMDYYVNKKVIFDLIEIETTNICNGTCDFCPVSRKNKKDKLMVMPDELFFSIIEQLADMNYSGRVALFCNNEPFTDPEIVRRHEYVRNKLPNATMHLFSNGTLLTVEKFVNVMKYLDELIIDNYSDRLKLHQTCKDIISYCQEHLEDEYEKRVTIILRNPHEVLSSRGGDAPNRMNYAKMDDYGCVRPFHALVIKADGSVPLCCSDPLGKSIMGNVKEQSLTDIWYGVRFKEVREALLKGRSCWDLCKACDFVSMF